jgi:ribokinase
MSGENSIVVVPRANHGLTRAHVRAARDLVAAADVLLLQLELPEEAVVEAATMAREVGTTVILNPAPAVADLAIFGGLVDYVVPNEQETRQLTGLWCEGEGAGPAAQALRSRTGARGVVLTLGARGVLAVDGDRTELIEAHQVPCIDSVGAGDAFCGAMAAALARGATLFEGARYGNAAGALAVTRDGAEPSMPTRSEVEALLAGGARPEAVES